MKEKGSALISVLLFVTVVAIISVPLFNSVLQDRMILEIENVKSQNHYAVESALELVKSSKPKNPSELSGVINKVNELDLEAALDVPVDVSLPIGTKNIVITSESNRRAADIQGKFGYLFGDFFMSNLFMTPRINHSPGQTVHITPRCSSCTTRTFIENLGSYLTVVNSESFVNELNNLVVAFDPTSTSDLCLSSTIFTYSHISCSNGTKLELSNNSNQDLTINGTVSVEGDFTLKNLRNVKIKGDVYIKNGHFIIDDVKKLDIEGDIVVGDGMIDILNVDIFNAERVIAWDTIEVKKTGGGNGDTSGVIINTTGFAAGGYDLRGKNQIIDIHAHGNSDLFSAFLEDPADTSDKTLIITHWNVGNR